MLFPRKYHERIIGGSRGKEDGESKTYQASHPDSRFKLNPEANSPYWYGQNNLPGYHDWLGSDYLQNQLRYNGEWRLKRLGDGYYEQQLVKGTGDVADRTTLCSRI